MPLLTRCRYCLGDAVHRHPPMNGLGSNTCIQDAANLAWKVALVEKGNRKDFGLHVDKKLTHPS
jgi:2-polyprenyl-6-methoxyphenol hydroxylase-like FAD-dependent oxidoreductase